MAEARTTAERPGADRDPRLDARDEITDPRRLRALAHPLRLAIMDLLATHGAATATECGERLGESAASCSYHLRTLARYGFVEDAPGGEGRERPWRLRSLSHAWRPTHPEPEVREAARALTDVAMRRHLEALDAWLDRRPSEPPEWREAGAVKSAMTWLTAAELGSLSEEVEALLDRHLERDLDPAKRPPGARPHRLLAVLIPEPPATPRP